MDLGGDLGGVRLVGDLGGGLGGVRLVGDLGGVRLVGNLGGGLGGVRLVGDLGGGCHLLQDILPERKERRVNPGLERPPGLGRRVLVQEELVLARPVGAEVGEKLGSKLLRVEQVDEARAEHPVLTRLASPLEAGCHLNKVTDPLGKETVSEERVRRILRSDVLELEHHQKGVLAETVHLRTVDLGPEAQESVGCDGHGVDGYR